MAIVNMPSKPETDPPGAPRPGDPSKPQAITRRKNQHLEICTDPERYAVEGGDTRLSQLRFVHHSLPELDESQVDTTVDFLGKRLALPLFISAMTGGSEAGFKANKDLARLAQAERLAVGMGSIRILFSKPELVTHFSLKQWAPDVPVVANLGAVQVRDMVHGQIIEMLKRLEVDALAIHLNPAQELVQAEGDRDFRGILESIKRFCQASPIPVVVKETGCGINPAETARLLKAGVAFVNIAGSGGTNWALVEAWRNQENGPGRSRSGADSAPPSLSAAREFTDWGNPTGLLLAALRRLDDAGRFGSPPAKPLGLPAGESFSAARVASLEKKGKKEVARPASEGMLHGRILASGGIRSGMDLAACLILGARAAGMALPFIRLIQQGGVEAGQAYVADLRSVLRRVMVLSDCGSIAQLRAAPYLLSPEFDREVRDFIHLFE
jgi:isopentenyl-diphosphate delta-isomerase type 2